ncbi:hypothetical protein niasHT_025218 [Heterodera trifolii]|uniref:Uncharacterized protein n=1 Tax=Heterodera trifolii TaxID=157864 RepID=A0ABD2KHM4_9BILA
MEDNGNLFGQLLGHFVRTESASPALLALLEQRLIAVIGHEIDAEIVRHSLLDHKSFQRRSSANISNCQPYHSKKKILAEFDFFDDSESLSHPTQSPPNNKNQNRSPLMVQHEIQRISDQLVEHSPALRTFRTKTLEECKDLVQNLWKIEQQKDSLRSKKGVPSGIFPPQNHLNGSNGFRPFSPQFLPPTDFAGGERQKSDEDEFEEYNSENEEEDEGGQQHNDVVELSSFSLDHSMQEWPDEEMQNIVWLICSDGMEQSVRLTNIQKLHFVSPVAFSKSKAFEIFLGHLHAVLPLPSLFSETMHILARILNCPNEMLWLKSANCLSRVVHGVIRSPSLGPNDKKSFADFFRQILFYGPQIWRHFEQPTICQIVRDLVEMLTVEISAGGGGGPSPSGFLEMLARVDPEALWLLPWLHLRSILTLMMPKFSELINEILDQHSKEKINGCDGTDEKPCHSPLFWAFEASVLFRCLQHSSVLSFLCEIVPDFAELQRSFCRAILHFLTLVFGPLPISAGPRSKGFGMARRIVVKGLLKTTMSDCGAAVLSSLPLFLMPLFAVPSSVGASLVVPMPSISSPSSFAQMFDLCLKVLLNVLLHAPPSLPSAGDVSAFLAKVEQSLRHHLTLFLHHNDNPFSNEITVQVLNALFEHFPIGQLRTAFSDLIHTLLITNISKLDHSNPNHRRLIVAIAYLTFMDHQSHSQSAYQWNQWRKNTGKMLSRIAMRNYSSICVGVSPANPSNGWATFPSAIELSENEQHLITNALLQFLGLQLQQEKFGQKPKSVQNCGAKLRPIGGHSRQSAPVSVASVRRPTDDTSPKVTTADSDYSHVSASSLASASSPSIRRLDFLPSVSNDFRPANCHSEPLPDFVFFLVTQSELLVELLRYGQFGHYLLNKFVSFERLKDSGAEHKMVEFVGKMDFLITNFDMLTDLRHFVPNLGARLVELLHKYCSDSSGNLLMSELSRRLCLFFSNSFVAAPSERRFLKFERIGQMHVALANIPQSIYAKLKTSTNGEEGKDEEGEEEDEEEKDGGSDEKEEKEGKTEGKERKKNNRRKRREEEKERKAIATHSNLAKSQKWDNESLPATEAKGQQKMADRFRHLPTLSVEAAEQWQNDRNHFEPTTVFGRNTRTVSMQLEERDFQFWFAVLPEKDTVATRHALLQILFSSTGDIGKMQQRMRSRPFELLAKFATKFWPMPEQNKMTMKPPPHSEWLSVLTDYAHGLALVRGSRAAVRQRIGTVRLLQQNGQSANDWFLAALFLSSGLSAEATSEFCERFLEWRRVSSSSAPFSLNVDSVWPVCCSVSSSSSSPCRSFSELLALRVFPRVLSLVRCCAAFRPLRAFLCSCRIPSLFHLFLFYTNQAYLGILPFRAVQEYLVVAVLGGPEFQALHFCAVLAHICDSSTRHHSLHFSSKLTSLFLRPIFLADFRFSKYALIEMDDH